MWAYSLIAIGLLNWDYQRSQPNVVMNSLFIILPGLLLLLLTFTTGGKNLLDKSYSKGLWAIVGLAAIIFAFINR